MVTKNTKISLLKFRLFLNRQLSISFSCRITVSIMSQFQCGCQIFRHVTQSFLAATKLKFAMSEKCGDTDNGSFISLLINQDKT